MECFLSPCIQGSGKQVAETATKGVLSTLLIAGVAATVFAIVAKTAGIPSLTTFPHKTVLLGSGATITMLTAIGLTVMGGLKTAEKPTTPALREKKGPKFTMMDQEYVRGEHTAAQKMRTQTRYAVAQKESDGAGNFSTESPINSACEVEAIPGAGLAAMQGRRPKMEDAHLATQLTLSVGEQTYAAKLFGVFDGHGSRQPALDVAEKLPTELERQIKAIATTHQSLDEIIPRAFTRAFVSIDEEIRGNNGTCAVCALELNGRLYFPNCGDSRAILIQKQRAVKMTEDARLCEERFARSIERTEGCFVSDGNPRRANGIMAVARDLGVAYLSPRPKITLAVQSEEPDNPQEGIVHYKPGDLVLLGCDGLFDVATTEAVASEVRKLRQDGLSLAQIAERVARSAVHSGDNVSVVLFETGNSP